MAVFAFIMLFFCPIITKMDKKVNELKQKTTPCGMMNIAVFFSLMDNEKDSSFPKPSFVSPTSWKSMLLI